MSLKSKKILIIIGGGISAYKALDLIRLHKKNNVDVKAILTKSGKEFVTPLSITTLTKNKTFEDIFDKNTEAEIDHIALSRWADLIIVIPTTANFFELLPRAWWDEKPVHAFSHSSKFVNNRRTTSRKSDPPRENYQSCTSEGT